MNYLTTEQVLFLHHRIIAETGGGHGVLDLTLLESAVGRPRATYGGADLYPGVHAKAAALVDSVIRNHPFVDGNKRSGIAAGALFLRRNGLRLVIGDVGAEQLALSVVRGEIGCTDLVAALRRGTASE